MLPCARLTSKDRGPAACRKESYNTAAETQHIVMCITRWQTWSRYYTSDRNKEGSVENISVFKTALSCVTYDVVTRGGDDAAGGVT